MDWIYGQIVGFLGNFFALMGNMGVELFELEWVSAIILFFSRLAWALFAVSVVVCAFECGIEYSTGRGNLQQCGMNIIKGFLAVSLFTVVPVRLYALSVSLQGTFSAGLTGYGRSIGEVGQDIITELSEIQTLADVVNSSHFGLGIITSPVEMSRNVQSGNTQNLKSTVIQRSFPKWSVAERRKTAAASDQAAVCACAHSRYFTGGSPSGLRV